MSPSSATWPPISVKQRLQDHHELTQLLRALSDQDDTASALARYLVVRSAGLIEAVRDDVTDQYCAAIGHPRLHRRVASGLRNGLGVTPSQLLDFLGTLDTAWRDEFEVFLDADDGARRNQLGALVAMRKKVAHGDGDQVTVGKALTWSVAAADVAKWLVARLDPR